MTRKNKNANRISKITILSEHSINNEKEIFNLDKQTIKNVSERIIDHDSPRELLITCTTNNRNSANDLVKTLTSGNDYSCHLTLKGNDNWIVDASIMLPVSQLEKELKQLYLITKGHSCELIDWRVEVDTLTENLDSEK